MGDYETEQKQDLKNYKTEQKQDLKDLAGRISKLETNQEVFQEVFQVHFSNFTHDIGELKGLMKLSIGMFISALLGFFFWYIQRL